MTIDEFSQGVLRGAAISLITWIDYNAAEGNMCLSNMECKDIEDALVRGDWNKIYAYMKKKLERQDEQKHIFDFIDWQPSKVDGKIHNIYNAGVESKVRVGEWLCENEPNNYARFIQILEIVNVQGKERYRISRDIHNDEDIVEVDFVEKYYHKFNIKDIKDGDVLAFEDDSYILLVKELHSTIYGMRVSCYCHVLNEKFEVAEYQIRINGLYPATKEQHALLFAKMREAGYEWNEDKKQLTKISK